MSLSHRGARIKVHDALQRVLCSASASPQRKDKEDSVSKTSRLHLMLYLVLPPCLCCISYIISLIVNPNVGLYPGLIITILILMIGMFINLYILYLLRASEEGEVQAEIKSIFDDYKLYLNTTEEYYKMKDLQEQTQQSPPLQLPQSPSPALPASIVSGNTQVSVVNVYRNMQWQRVPVLLLAEGDIIALMGGDVTPGLVHELIPVVSVSPGGAAEGSKFQHQMWRRGATFERGVKIFLRRNAASPTVTPTPVSPTISVVSDLSPLVVPSSSSTPQQHPTDSGAPVVEFPAPSAGHLAASNPNPQHSPFERHRSLASDSTELLHLSGDIRCFLMGETPIENFCKCVLDKNRHTCAARRVSLASVFPLLTSKPPTPLPGDTSVPFNLESQEPLTRMLFYAVIERGLRLMLVTIAMFLVCSIIRLCLEQDSRTDWTQAVLTPLATIVVCFIPVSLPLLLFVGDATMTADILATTEVVLQTDSSSENQEASQNNNPNLSSNQSTRQNLSSVSSRSKQQSLVPQSQAPQVCGDQEADDFSSDGEFLDEDIDERAEEIADEASTRVQYTRLLQYVGHVLWTRLTLNACRSRASFHHATSRTTALLPVPLLRTRLTEMLGAVTMVCFVDDDVVCEGYSVTEEIFLLHSDDHEGAGRAMGTVLDLHANPEATGSRFEDPRWWKHLPSLKPIGLNALLTYIPTPPIAPILNPNAADESKELIETSEFGDSGGLVALSKPASSSHRPVTAPGTTKEKRRERLQNINHIESSLVGHIRRSIPFESLRELAEEIGFVQEDIACFNRLLEINVMAPGLGDVRLVEDPHAWGQEETRRRGTLTSHMRGAVVRDSRGGGLQMLSQGDPSLILNYCREYWEGSSITPLTAADRKEVLAVYDRWDLEDFDVVAFSYSPVPASLQPLILHAHGTANDPIGTGRSSKGLTQGAGAGAIQGSQAECLFFVDPRTAAELESIRRKTSAPGATVEGGSLPANKIGAHVTNSPDGNDVASSAIELGGVSEYRNSGAALGAEIDASYAEPVREATDGGNVAHVVVTTESGLSQLSSILTDDAMTTSAYEEVDLLSLSPTASRIPRMSPDAYSMEGHGEISKQGGALHDGTEYEVGMRDYEGGVGDMGDYDGGVGDYAIDASLLLDVGIGENEGLDDPDGGDGESAAVEEIAHEEVERSTVGSRGDDALSHPSRPPSPSLRSNSPRRSVSDSHLFVEFNRSTSSPSPSTGPDSKQQTNFSPQHLSSIPVSGNGIYEGEHRDDGKPQVCENGSSRARSPGGQGLVISPLSQIEGQVCPAVSQGIDDEGSRAALIAQSRQSDPRENVPFSNKSLSSSAQSIAERSPSSSPAYVSKHDGSPGREPLAEDISQDRSLPEFAAIPLAKSLSLDRALGAGLGLLNTPFMQTGGKVYPPSPREGDAPLDSAGMDSIMHAGGMGLGSSRASTPSSHVSTVQIAASGGANMKYNKSSDTREGSREERKQRLLQIEAKRSNKRLARSLGANLWHLLRQQVFLGMAASSVPIRPEVPNLMEDLTSAGVRFMYFSPRNMRRSKPVAEKIGIQFDWNCAISLRDLDHEDGLDPHRHISNYADWDVHARMPHGVDAIKNHLRVVDNVPLLVSLYTDSTPSTTRQMIEVFREYGEVVLTVGSSYRAQNNDIFAASSLAVSVAMLPGEEGQIPAAVDEVVREFSDIGHDCLSKGDLLLTFRLVGLGAVPLLQLPTSCAQDGARAVGDNGLRRVDIDQIAQSMSITVASPQLRLSAILEAIRMGRVFLLNTTQALAMLCVAIVSLGMWPLIATAVPMSIPPSLPPSLAMLFLLVHLPIILLAMLHSPAPHSVLKNTPRKNLLVIKPSDEQNFSMYLFMRAGVVLLSVFVVGWLALCNAPSNLSQSPDALSPYRRYVGPVDTAPFPSTHSNGYSLMTLWLVQDLMSCEMLLALFAQAITLVERGQKIMTIPTPYTHSLLYSGMALSTLIHAVFILLRAYFRYGSAQGSNDFDGVSGFAQYLQLDWVLWVVLLLLPIVGIVVGLVQAADDDIGYRRYLHFLRLEFDTRLGMHSPR